MARRKPVAVQAFPPRTVQSFRSGRGGKNGVWFTRCVDGREPEIHELWTFAKDRTREVHPFAWIKIIDDFTGETFHTDFLSVKGCRVDLLYQISVNGSVERLDVPRPFFDTEVATAAWTENFYVDPWIIMDSPPHSDRSPDLLSTYVL